MSDANNSDLLLTAAISMGDVTRDVQASFRATKQFIEGQTVEMNIAPKLDAAALRARIKEVTNELAGVTAAIKAAETNMAALTAATDKAAQELEKSLPGATKRMQDAIKQGVDAAKVEIAALKTELENALVVDSAKAKRAFERSVENLRMPAIKAATETLRGKNLTGKFDGASPEETALAMFMRMNSKQSTYWKMQGEYAALPNDDRNKAVMKDNVERARRAAKRSEADVLTMYGGDQGAYQKGYDAAKRLYQTARATAPNLDALTKSVEGGAGNTGLPDLQKTATSLASVIRTMLQPKTEGLGRALGSAETEVTNLASAAKAAVATVANIASATGGGATPSGGGLTRGQRTRRDQLDLIMRKAEARRLSKTSDGSESFLRTIGAEHLIPLAREASAYKSAEFGTPAHDAATARAIPALSDLRVGIEDFLKGPQTNDRQRELMHVYRSGFMAEFGTGLDNRIKRVGENGPNNNAIGALSSVDRLNLPMVVAARERRFSDISGQLSHYAGFAADFGDTRHRDQFAEATAAYRKYTDSRIRFENEFRNFADADSAQEKEVLAKRVVSAQREMEFTQETVRQRALLMSRGTLAIPTASNGVQDMSFNAARVDINRRLVGSLGDSYGSVSQARGGMDAFSFSDFKKGLFGGNVDIAQEFLHAKGYSSEILNDHTQLNEVLEKEIGHLREIYKIEGNINSEVERQVRHVNLANQASGGGNGNGYKNTIRGAFALAGGIGLGYQAYSGITSGVKNYMNYQQELAGIQGVLPGKDPRDRDIISNGIGQSALKYGANLLEAAKAARMFAESGLSANEVIKELDSTLLASKGMGMTTEQVENLQLAIRAVTSENEHFNQSISWTSAVIEKISSVEARYAVTSRDLAQAITVLTPVVSQFSDKMTGLTDVFDIVNGMTTVIVEKLRITGTQAANAEKMMFSRLARPEILTKLQQNFGAKFATKDGKDLLPLDELLPSMGRRYQELKQTDPLKAKQFAVQLSGGRNISAIVTLLENYQRAQRISIESSYAWGSAQDRAAISTNTMASAVERISTSFQLFIKNMMDASYVGKGLQASLNGVASVMGGVSGAGGGTGSLMALITAGGLAYSGGKAAYGILSKAKGFRSVKDMSQAAAVAGKMSDASGLVKLIGGIAESGGAAGTIVSTLSAAFGALAELVTPGGVLLLGLTAVAAAIGFFTDDDKGAALDRYKTKIKSLQDLKVWDAPQMQQFQSTFVDGQNPAGYGYHTAQKAYQDTISSLSSIQGTGLGSQLGMSDKQLDDWLTHAGPENIKAYQLQFAKAFIEQLPADARAGFNKIKNEQELIGKVAESVGGAAFAANVQIANSIEAIRDATMRMVSDSIASMKELDRTARQGIWQKGIGAIKDAFTGADLQNAHPLGTGLANSMAVMQGMGLVKKLPMFSADGLSDTQAAAQTDVLTKAMQGIVTAAAASGKKEITSGELLNSFLDQANTPNSVLFGIAKRTSMRATNPEGASALASALLGQTKEVGIDQIGANLNKLGVSLTESNIPDIKNTLQGKIAGAKESANAHLIMEHKLGVDGGTAGASSINYALVAFKDTLLDVVLAMHESMIKLRTEERFTTQFGYAYDKGGAMQSFGRSLIEQGGAYRADRQTDIAKLLNEIPNIRMKITSIDKQKLKPDAVRREEIADLLSDRRSELTRFTGKNLSGVLKNSGPEGQQVLKDINEAIAGVGVNGKEAGSAIEDVISLIGKAFVIAGQDISLTSKMAVQKADQVRSIAEKSAQLNEAALPINAKLLTQLIAKEAIADSVFAADKNSLDVKLQQKTISKEDYDLQLDSLNVAYEVNKVYDARMATIQAQHALDSQVMANMQAAVEPLMKLFTDPSVWQNVVGWDKAWQSRAEALRTLFLSTFSGIAKSFNDRIFENLNKKLLDSLFSSSALKDLFGAPESVLKESVQGAVIFENGIVAGSQVGGQYMYQMIVAAMTGKGPIGIGGGFGTSVGNPQFSGEDHDGLGGLFGAGGATAASTTQGMSPEQKKMLFAGVGLMVGQTAGTLIGRGGANAQMGSQIGSTLGMGGAALLGHFAGGTLGAAGGPVGLAIGAALGGILGGLMGGNKDKADSPASPVIKGLDAIERAQRETITTIQSQTDALLKPDNRLMNLPTTFDVPSYNPGFSGSSSSAPMTQQNNIELNVNVQGGNPDDVRQAVEDAVGNILYDQRRNQNR